MAEKVTRDALLSFFIDSCYLLENYRKVEGILYEQIEKDELELENILNDYRENQSFEWLIPMLIFASRYYSQQKANNVALKYLIECECILENLETDNLLKGYIFAELGYIYETKGVFKEADFYYMSAASFGSDKKIPLLTTYALERLIYIILVSCHRKSIERFQTFTADYQNQDISDYLKYQIELLRLYLSENYEEIILNIEPVDETQENTLLMKKAICAHSLFQLNRSDEIEWDLNLLELVASQQSDVYCLIYHLTYHLVHDNDEQLYDYITKLSNNLKGKQQNGWLRFVYQFLSQSCEGKLNEVEGSEFQDSLNKLTQQVSYQEQRLKHRMQGIYHNYRQYYNGIHLIRNKRKYKVVSWKQLPISYRYEYTSKTVVGYFKLDHCFYSDFNTSLLKQVIEMIDEFIGESITFSVEKEGLWFYFKACCSEIKLKRKLNRLVERWYEKLGQSYFVTFCLPQSTTDSFEETIERVKSSFYGMILKSRSKLSYEVNFCQEKFTRYNFSVKIHQLLEKANHIGEFTLNYSPLYYRDGHQLFGIECHNILDDYSILNQLPVEEREEASPFLNIEKEIYLFKLGCDYLKDYDEKNSVKLSLFIKFSRQTLLNKCLCSRILTNLKEDGIDPNQVIISVNEDILFEQNVLIQKAIKRLREFGVNIALDEYGAGALTGSIRNLSIDYLRISSCFIQYLKSSKNCLSMMNSLINVCMSKDVKICCSEIENESSLHLIRDFGIDVVSGSYYQRKLVV